MRFAAAALAFMAHATLAAPPAPPAPGLADPKFGPWFNLIVDPGVLQIDEGGSGQFSVTTSSRPTADVAVDIYLHPGAQDAFRLGRTRLVFTPENWHRRQRVRIWALQDADAFNESAPVRFTVSSDGLDATRKTVRTVRAIDDERAEVLVDPSVLNVDEGGSARISVVLGSQPWGDVEVRVTPDAPDRVVTDRTRLTFSRANWNRPRTVEISARHDDDAADDVATVTLAASGADYDAVDDVTAAVHVIDDDTLGVTVTPAVLTVDEGETGLFSVTLTARPTEDVVVRLLRDTTHFALPRNRLTFAPDNWNQPQTLKVIARQDPDAVDEVTTLTLWIDGDVDSRAVATARANDDETLGVTVTPAVLTVDEGETGLFSVMLTARPTEDVVVRLLRDTTHFALPRNRLTFAPDNWNQPQTLKVIARQDPDAVDDVTILTLWIDGDVDSRAVATARANDDDRGLSAELTVATTLAEHQPRVAATFCMTPLGAELNELSDFQLANVTRVAEPDAVAPSPQDGVLVYRPVPVEVAGCNGGRGVRMTGRYLPDQTHLVRTRARKGSRWVVSNLVTVRDHDPATVLRARLWGDGFEGVDSIGEPVFPDVPETVHGEFEIAAAFGFWVHFTSNTDRVNGLELDDFVATNATLSMPPGGFEHQAGLGYRLRVTPTTLGEDVTVQIRAGAVIEPFSAKTNLASNVFRRRTAPAPPGHSAARAGQPAVEVSAADASAREGPRAIVSFPVRLSRAAQAPVSVRYATSDGTARAGEDYVATSGTLTFRPGDAERPVTVPVLDDARDEGAETFTLTLSDPSGATLADAVATGTIENTDPLPREWITRFGRTVAAQAVDAIGARVSGAQGTQVVIAGRTVERPGSAGADPDVRGRPHASPGFENSHGSRTTVRTPGMTPRQLALASEFQLASGNAGNEPVWTTWGRVAASHFEAAPDEIELDGDVTTGFLGFDVEHERWLAGVAMSLGRGDGSFEHPETGGDDGAVGGGSVESRLTSLHPYVRYRLTERTDVWAMAGYGTGEITLTERAGGNRLRDVVIETGIEMRMGALGARGRILPPQEPGGLEVALRTDAFWVRTESDAVDSAHAGRMEASVGDASRVRVLVEGSRTFELGDSGAAFTPSAEVGIRHDGGDAETGTGVAAGAGARIAAPGIAVEVALRSLVAHDEQDHEGWSASGSLRIDPGVSGRGLSLGIAPRWGTPVTGVDRLWTQHDPAEPRDTRASGSGTGLAAELGYGLRAPVGRGVLTPYTGAEWTDDGVRAYRLGARWEVTPRASLGLEGTHRESGGADGSGNALGLRASVRW